MTGDNYQILAKRTMATRYPTPSNATMMLLNGALGLAGESGELVDHIKKHVFHGHGLDPAVVLKEAGDVLWYLAEILEMTGLSMSDAMRENIEKLTRRFPDGFDPDRTGPDKEH